MPELIYAPVLSETKAIPPTLKKLWHIRPETEGITRIDLTDFSAELGYRVNFGLRAAGSTPTTSFTCRVDNPTSPTYGDPEFIIPQATSGSRLLEFPFEVVSDNSGRSADRSRSLPGSSITVRLIQNAFDIQPPVEVTPDINGEWRVSLGEGVNRPSGNFIVSAEQRIRPCSLFEPEEVQNGNLCGGSNFDGEGYSSITWSLEKTQRFIPEDRGREDIVITYEGREITSDDTIVLKEGSTTATFTISSPPSSPTGGTIFRTVGGDNVRLNGPLYEIDATDGAAERNRDYSARIVQPEIFLNTTFRDRYRNRNLGFPGENDQDEFIIGGPGCSNITASCPNEALVVELEVDVHQDGFDPDEPFSIGIFNNGLLSRRVSRPASCI